MKDPMHMLDFNWHADHGLELHRDYAGKWIAVYEERVIGVGDTAVEAARQAEEKAPAGKYILQALDHDGDVV